MKEITGRLHPDTFFLSQDENGMYHCFRRDPMKVEDPEDEEITSIADLISDFAGPCDIANPVVFRFAAEKINRCTRFTITLPDEIRVGKVNQHIQDMTGRIVEILNSRNPDPEFPLNGVVFDRSGAMLTTRTYAADGSCSDRIGEHHLIGVVGPAVFGGGKED